MWAFFALLAGMLATPAMAQTETIDVVLDIKPGSCEDQLNLDSCGILTVVILGGQPGYGIDKINDNPQSLDLIIGGETFHPFHVVMEDVIGEICSSDEGDGQVDLVLHFFVTSITEEVAEEDWLDQTPVELSGDYDEDMTFKGEGFLYPFNANIDGPKGPKQKDNPGKFSNSNSKKCNEKFGR